MGKKVASTQFTSPPTLNLHTPPFQKTRKVRINPYRAHPSQTHFMVRYCSAASSTSHPKAEAPFNSPTHATTATTAIIHLHASADLAYWEQIPCDCDFAEWRAHGNWNRRRNAGSLFLKAAVGPYYYAIS